MANNAGQDRDIPLSAKEKGADLKRLKAILWLYIALCIVIAGVNYGYAPSAPQPVAEVIMWVWLIYENWVKTLFIMICGYLTLKITGQLKKNTMRRRNLQGFFLAALVVHIFGPFITGNHDLYFYAMPLPWSAAPLQLLSSQSSLYQSTLLHWGPKGITGALLFSAVISLAVLLGTLIMGRRFQCSTICLFNGFAAEVFEPAIPLIGKKRKPTPGMLKIFQVLRWLFLGIAIFFTGYWVLIVTGVTLATDINFFSKLASYKYLVGELLMAIFFWIAFLGRGYCFYCPLGTVLGLVSKIGNQRIVTNKSRCIQCGKCNDACPMAIEIKARAAAAAEVRDLGCVGCGHCVDSCPTQTLQYSTGIIDLIAQRRDKRSTSKL